MCCLDDGKTKGKNLWSIKVAPLLGCDNSWLVLQRVDLQLPHVVCPQKFDTQMFRVGSSEGHKVFEKQPDTLVACSVQDDAKTC